MVKSRFPPDLLSSLSFCWAPNRYGPPRCSERHRSRR